MASVTPPRLSVEGLRLSFGERVLCHDVSLALSRGEIAVIEGPSGCGKSTLLRALARLDDPDRGRLSLEGRDAASLAPTAWRRRVAYVFQQPPMFEGSVADNFSAGPSLIGKTMSRDEVGALADRVGIDRALLDRPAKSLSGGERMRAAIARALANDPSVLLLDEPTAALDSAAASMIVALVRELAASGVSAVVVTHSREHAEALGGTRYTLSEHGLTRMEEGA